MDESVVDSDVIRCCSGAIKITKNVTTIFDSF